MRRDELKMLADMLRSADGKPISRIANSCNLNFNRCKEKMGKLLDNGLVRRGEEEYKTTDGSKTLYRRTEKGEKFLSTFDELMKMCGKA